MDKFFRISNAVLVGLIIMMALAGAANSQCCGGGAWTSGPSFLGTTPIVCPGNLPDDYFDGGKIEASENISEECAEACADGTSDDVSQDDSNERLDENPGENLRENPILTEMIISPEKLAQALDSGKYVLAYTSNTPSDLYIKGTVALPSKSFIRENSSLKSVSDLAEMLGASGILENDTLVVYGNCLSCGDPTFVFWAMKYLGHDNVRLLEGTKEDWKLAGLSLEKSLVSRSSVDYLPDPNPVLFADYEYILGGEARIVDARPASDFSSSHIEGSFNLEYGQMLEDGHIKDPADLESVFSGLDKGQSVVVYSKNGGRASLVWLALETAGYDARLYTWKDWLAHQG